MTASLQIRLSFLRRDCVASGFDSGLGDTGPAATQRRTRSAHGALAVAGAKGGAEASHRAAVSTRRASASSIHRNGIGFRIGLCLARYSIRTPMVANPSDQCL